MNHVLLTIIAPVPPEDVGPARALTEALGNPATAEIAAAIEGLLDDPRALAVHFASLNVFDAAAGGGHLVFELSADGDVDALLPAIAERLGSRLSPIFALARDRGGDALDVYWKAHLVTVGQGFFDNPGVAFAGTPGQSVRRIRQESGLAAHVSTLLGNQAMEGRTALEQLSEIRRALKAEPQWQWALVPQQTASLEPGRSIGQAAGPLAWSALRTYLWPLFVPPIVAMIVVLARHGLTGDAVVWSISTLLWAAILTLLAALVGVGLAYLALRRKETSDLPEDRPPDPRVVARITARENFALQNHLAAVSVMKPGLLRRALVRVVFWLIANLATHLYRPGFLGTLGTIHFARWVMVPGTGDLLFLSNYGGSWESYLEDFITKAHFGLTAVWSNTVGFPRTSNLVQEGATDGARFKRWARWQQVPSAFWYVAYPDVTTANIRTNAAIQQGLATILTDEEASRWLSLFGSAARPPSALEVNRIQSLVFGGLGFLPHGLCLGFRLSSDRTEARRWLAAAKSAIAFGDGRKHPEGAVTLGLSPMALSKLGLPDESIDTFPPAFLDGMCSPWRSRVLGDEGKDDPKDWWWGGPQSHVDGVLLIYAPTRLELRQLRKGMTAALWNHGHEVVTHVPLRALPDRDATPDERRHAKREPFGFVDGVSQPIIRGTYKALRGADPIHIVEAGEFLLGYPDNRGFPADGPTLAAVHDPGNVLPIAGGPQPGFANPIVNERRDIGRNGSFLAIRQLEQYVDAFDDYCADAARQVQARFPHWDGVTPEFIGAKMIGRWRDGSSLVRFPYRSGTDSRADEHPMTRTAGGAAVMAPQPALPLPAPAAAFKQIRSLQAAARRAAAAPDAPPAVNPVEPDNDFLFGAEDPQALRCPFGAHIRRSNPRESFEPWSQEQLAITNRHRILRVGRFYRPLKGQRPGLFFMCLNADIERQFEFVQQTWVQAPSFHGLCGERDPLLGSRSAADSFTVPSREGPVRLAGLPTFVRTRGGGYFFLPGRTLLDYLAARADAPANS